MKLFNLVKKFRNDESGAVTVDWVVLTAAVVGLGIAMMTLAGGGTKALATKISSQLSGTSVMTSY